MLNDMWKKSVADSAAWLQEQEWQRTDPSMTWEYIAEQAIIDGLRSVPDRPTGLVYGYINGKEVLRRPMTMAELLSGDGPAGAKTEKKDGSIGKAPDHAFAVACAHCTDTADSHNRYVSTYCHKRNEQLLGFGDGTGPIPCRTCPYRTSRTK